MLVVLAAAGCGTGGQKHAASRHSTSTDFKIVVTGLDSGRRIGPYHYGSAGDYASAVHAFGKPSSRGTDNPVQSNLCTVRWRLLGIDVAFATSAPNPCGPTRHGQGAWYGATVHTRRWSTARGLRVGDAVTRLTRLYPRAAFHDVPPLPPHWTLVRQRRPDPIGITDVLVAEVWGGKVVAFRLPPDYIY